MAHSRLHQKERKRNQAGESGYRATGSSAVFFSVPPLVLLVYFALRLFIHRLVFLHFCGWSQIANPMGFMLQRIYMLS